MSFTASGQSARLRCWVTAASNWHEPPQRKRVREGLPGAPLCEDAALRTLVASQRLQRAIGVIYRPDTKRQSHYSFTRLAQQFDAVIHFAGTNAVEPLDVGQVWSDREVPETFPSGT